jgi:lipoprotein LpqS
MDRLRSTIVVVAVAWLLAGAAGAHCGLPRFESPSAHPSRSSTTLLGSQIAINLDHANLSDGARSSCPAKLATPVTPRFATPLVALGAVVAVVAITGLFGDLVAATVRGPPSGLTYLLTGQSLLPRLCVARR